MKVIAKKIFYEQDLYHFSDEDLHWGLFPIDKVHAAPARLEPELVYKKGDFKEWKFATEEICCTSMKLAIESEQVVFQDPIYFVPGHENSEEKIQRAKRGVDAFITCACWPIQLMKISFCPFCGEKIMIEEEK